MLKITLTILSSYLFSGYLFATTKQAAYINKAYMNTGSVVAPDSSKHVREVINRAHELIGVPYHWGGASVSKGFDCSGLLFYLFRSEAGIQIPRSTSSMLNSKAKTIYRRDLKSGDAVFFKHNGRNRMKHVGLYIGNNQFIHAPRTGKSIRIDSLENSYWNKSYLTAKRFH